MTKGWLGKLGLLGVSLGVALGLAEIVLRVLSPGYSPLFLDMYREDGHGLVLLLPGVERKHVTAEWRITIGANSAGLRDRAVPLPDSGGTVLGIGDSFVFGWGVEFDEAFLTRAEELLRPRGVRIVKAGMPGAGPSDYARFLETYGEEYTPDVVLVSVFVGNDFTDVQMGGVSGQFTVRDGLMVKENLDDDETRRPSPLRRVKNRLKTSSLLAQQAAQGLWFLERTFLSPQDRENPGLNARDRWLWEFAKVHLRNPPPETVESFTLTTNALDGIADWCDRHGTRMALIVIPRGMQVYEWERERWKKAYDLAETDLDLDRPQQLLIEWAAARAVPVLDLLPAFRVEAAKDPAGRLYFYPNSHMNVAGHALTGRLVADFLEDLITVQSPAPRS